MSDDAPSGAPMDKLIAKYVQLRDRKADLKRKFTEDTAAIDAGMAKIEAFLMSHLMDTGAESIKTPAGTVFTTTQTSATVDDWDQVLAWIKANEQWSILDKRVNKSFVANHIKEHNDLPPGVGWREEKVVQIRRS